MFMARYMLNGNRHGYTAKRFYNVGVLRIESAHFVNDRWILLLDMSRELLHRFRRNLHGLLRRNLTDCRKIRDAAHPSNLRESGACNICEQPI